MGLGRFFQFVEPPIAERDMADFIVENPLHELAGGEIAMLGKEQTVVGSEVEVGHFEGEAHEADVFEGSCQEGDVGPKVAV